MSESSRTVARHEANAISTKSRTDWERVKRDAASDAPIPYDPEDGPYDPNDDAAVEAYWKEAIIRRADGTIIQQPVRSK